MKRDIPQFTIDRALTDRNLLGAALGNPSTWAVWLSILRAAFTLPMSDQDKELFAQVSGGRTPPTQRVRELWAIVGRRGGKSRVAAALAVYLACFCKYKLAPGEVGTVLVVANNKDQAQIVFNYALAFFQFSPVLAKEVGSTTASEIRLKNGLVISVHANSFRSVRGRTLVAVIFDETAFWRDETSATPDLEVYRAVRPSLMTTKGMLVGISTPYRRVGLLHQKYRDHYGTNDDAVLVVQGTSIGFNPNLTESDIAQALADDPEANRAEFEAEFRSDLAAFLDDELINAAVDHGRPLELPPRQGLRYLAFADPSGGRHDAFTVCIGHKENDGFVADVVRGTRPPFDPVEVVKAYAELCKEYRVSAVHGDNYSAEWATSAFKDAGMRYIVSDKPKSQLYLEALPLFTRRAISLPDHTQLLRELRLLERQTHRSGKDTVDHGRRGSDDHANAVCGCATFAARRLGYDLEGVDHTDGKPDNAAAAFQQMRLMNHIRRYG
jgi:Phage Terminase